MPYSLWKRYTMVRMDQPRLSRREALHEARTWDGDWLHLHYDLYGWA